MKDYLNYQGDLSKLSKKDLEYLFLLLKDYQLQYKECLGIDEKISFGVEVEFEDILLYYVTKELKQYPKFRYWSCIPDKSCSYKIDDFVVGGEVVTPILHDISIDWQMLSAAVEILKKLGANSTKRTSLHVHVGGQIFGEDIKNENVTPKGNPALEKPINNGIEEQEQKGVTVPRSAEIIFAQMPLNLLNILLLFSGGK